MRTQPSNRLKFLLASWLALAAFPAAALAYDVEGPHTLTLSQDDSVFLSIQNTQDAGGPKEMRFFHTDPDGSGGYYQMFCRSWEACQEAKTLYEGALSDGSKLRLDFDSGHITTVEIVKPKGIVNYLADATDSVLRGMSSVTNRTRPVPSLKSAGLSDRVDSGHFEAAALGAGQGGGPLPAALIAGGGR